MPRNASGTYTLPTGNPVVTGTIIESTWANDTLSDVASALTNSLSRDGAGGMTAALRVVDGSVSVPGLGFANETGSGLYRAAAGDVGLTVLGARILRMRSTGLDVTGNLNVSGDTLSVTSSTAYFPQLLSKNKTADANASYHVFDKDRAGAIVQDGDVLGNLVFRGWDGANYVQAASIISKVSGVPGTNDMPGDLLFLTTADGASAPVERMKITNAGDVNIFGGKGLAWFDSTNANYWAQYNDSGNFIVSNGAERLRIESSGNVGIGASDPYSPLDVGTTGANTLTSLFTTGVDDLNFRCGFMNGVAGGDGTLMGRVGMFYLGTGEAASVGFVRGASTTDSSITFRTDGNERARIAANGAQSSVIPGGTTLYPEFKCRAWVNFNGTGTVSIRHSGNVSSITDLGVANYRVNMTTAMPTVSYAVVGLSDSASGNAVILRTLDGTTARTTSYFRLESLNATFSGVDSSIIQVGVFR